MMMTELKKRRKINIRSYFVATDYTCSPGVNQTAMDAYFIPHKKLIKEFADNGLPMSRIIPSGIPVRRDFYNKTEPQKAKRTLSLPQDKRVALLMCGSMGLSLIHIFSYAARRTWGICRPAAQNTRNNGT